MIKIFTPVTCLVLTLLLTACGHGWKHDTVPEAKWDEAYADCVYQAESSVSGPSLTQDPVQNWGVYGEVRYRTDKCMEEKGYYQGGDRQ